MTLPGKGRPYIVTLIAVAGLLLAARGAHAAESLQTAIARAYGLDGFGNITAIRYTFNVKRKGLEVHRSWTWEPKTNHISYKGPDDKGRAVECSYDRNTLDTAHTPLLKIVDPRFINDQYWLLFPFHLVWDKAASIQDDGRKPMPIGGGIADHLIVRYPNTGGYTPGDVFELFTGSDHIIRQWIYRRAGATTPSLIAKWEDHNAVGPIMVSLEHESADKSLRVWFSDVAVQLEGSNQWLTPHAGKVDR